jgi:hypothetical protein
VGSLDQELLIRVSREVHFLLLRRDDGSFE